MSTGRKYKSETLFAYLNNKLVGTYHKAANGAIRFAYTESWLSWEHSFPISTALPLREQAFSGDHAMIYFENLLPDNQKVRKKIAEKAGAKSSQTFDLLSTIGRDCIGAVQLLPEEVDSPVAEVSGTSVSDSEIAKIIRNLYITPLGIDINHEFRISLAGAQEKTALLKKNGSWHIPTGTTPTTHILKPPMGKLEHGIDMRDSVENEWLCAQIASHLGLDVARTEMSKFDDQKCLIVERFDRQWSKDGKRIFRLPQEDMCQALGFYSSGKYEQEGGPGIESIMSFLNSSNKNEEDRETFIRSQIVFFLLGATDGHAKNFSIFLRPSGHLMTPLYDILTCYPAYSSKEIQLKNMAIAMAVGNKRRYKIGKIYGRHFIETAEKCNFLPQRASEIIQDVVKRAERIETSIEIPKGFPQKILDATYAGIKKYIGRLKE